VVLKSGDKCHQTQKRHVDGLESPTGGSFAIDRNLRNLSQKLQQNIKLLYKFYR